MFEGERARGRVEEGISSAARDRPGPGQRDRAVSSQGGASDLSNHDHAGKVGGGDGTDNLNIFVFWG